VSVPDEIRESLKQRLWREADELGCMQLSRTAKTQWYSNWATDPTIGGVIERYIDPRRVRLYLKDTFLKRYSVARKAAPDRPLRVLGLSESAEVTDVYEKPHGRRLADGRLVVWGKASEWKGLLMALHERAFGDSSTRPYGVVFSHSAGRFADVRTRALVEDAAAKLGVEQVLWLET
jgi:hypothetical protein